MIFQNWAYRTLRVHRVNAKGKMPLTHVFDVIRRPDSHKAILLETWGGFNKGYARQFNNEADALVYLGKRLNKIVRPADATIGLGELKGEQTKITLDEGHFRVVHSKKFDEATELTKTLMTKRLSKEVVKAFGEAIGYEETGWHNSNNVGRILNTASKIDTNATFSELMCAMIARIGLNAETDHISTMPDSLVNINDFCFLPTEQGEETMFPGDFSKGFAMSANIIRKHKPIMEVDDAPKKVKDEVLTEEEKEMMHSKQYTSWGAWS